MALITKSTTGRQLMVLDDAETIAHQARRRAALQRRRQDAVRVAVVAAVVLSTIALIIGVSVQTVVLVFVGLFVAGVVGFRQLQELQDVRRRHHLRAQIGQGIGTPRPKGGFSTTRHRSGAPVWVDRRAA